LLSAIATVWCGTVAGCDSDPPGEGTLQVSIVAFNPGDLNIESVALEPTRVEAIWSRTPDGEEERIILAPPPEPQALNLAVSATQQSVLIFASAVPAGFIHELRLITPDGLLRSRALDPDGEILSIPSGRQSGIKAASESGEPFPIRGDSLTHILILLDAGAKIHPPGCAFDVDTQGCRASPPPRDQPGRESGGGLHVFPDYLLEPSLPARLLSVRPIGGIPPQFAEDQVFVMFQAGTPRARAEELARALGAVVLRQSALDHPWYTYLLPPDSNEDDIAVALRSEFDVRVATPNYSVQFVSQAPPELEPENQLEGFEYDPWWLPQASTFAAWDTLAAARGEEARYGDASPIVAVLDQSPYPYTPDLEENLYLNPGELPEAVSFNRACVDTGTADTLLDVDTDGSGAIDGFDWDVNADGGVTLADFNVEPYRSRINTAMTRLGFGDRAPDQVILMEDIIKPDGFDRDQLTCGLFEDNLDSALDDNTLIDDLAGYSFFSGDNWTYAEPIFTTQTQPAVAEIVQHGTKVAGFVAAAVNDRSPLADVLPLESYVGVAPRSRILQVAFLTPGFDEVIDDSFIDRTADAIAYAVEQEADVISASWTLACAPSKDEVPGALRCSDQAQSAKFERIGLVFDELEVMGLDRVLFVAGGPNEAVDLDRGDVQALPGELPNDYIITVGSSDTGDSLAPDTTFGPTTFDIAAPSHDVTVLNALGRTTDPISGEILPGLEFETNEETDALELVHVRGISFAIPQVAATAALLISLCPELRGDPLAIKEHIISSADCDLDGLSGRIGGGCRLNVDSAVRSVMPENGGACP
jgi:hypothetical protein